MGIKVIINHVSTLCQNNVNKYIVFHGAYSIYGILAETVVALVNVYKWYSTSLSREFKKLKLRDFKRHICYFSVYTQVGNSRQPSQIGLVLASSPGETD